MKTNLKSLALIAIGMTFLNSCSKETEEVTAQGEKQPVQFVMNVGQASRTTTGTDAGRTTTWSDGDAVGIFVYKHGDTTSPVNANVKYTLSGSTWAAEAGSEIYTDEAYDFYAYYPYDATVTDPTKVSMTALADQTSADNYAKSDFLAAQNTSVAAGATTVALTFSHLFSMVEVTVTGDKVSQQPTKVTLNNVKLATAVDITAATPAAAVASDATATEVNMYYLTKTTNADSAPFVFRAVVPAQEIAAGTSLTSIYAPDADAKTYTMQYNAAVTYEAGKCRSIQVKINKDKVALDIPATDFTFNPWGESEAIEGEGTQELEKVTSLTPELTTSTVFKALGKFATNSPITETTDTWFTRFNNETTPSTYTVIEEDGVAVIKAKIEGGARGWNNNSFGYHSAGTYERCNYKLTYEVKGEVEKTAGGFAIRTSDDKAGFKLDGASGNVKTFTLNTKYTEWTKGTAIFDFTKKHTTQAATIKTEEKGDFTTTTDDDVKGINIYIYNNLASSTLYVRNIKLEKVSQ